MAAEVVFVQPNEFGFPKSSVFHTYLWSPADGASLLELLVLVACDLVMSPSEQNLSFLCLMMLFFSGLSTKEGHYCRRICLRLLCFFSPFWYQQQKRLLVHHMWPAQSRHRIICSGRGDKLAPATTTNLQANFTSNKEQHNPVSIELLIL